MRMRLKGDTSEITRSGQFVNILLDGFYLRRPISVNDVEGDVLTIIYKVVGKGTEKMRTMEGGTLDILTGLGNGYDLSPAGDCPLLVGGGVGVPPLYMLARKLIAQGKSVSVILGFNTKSEIFYEEEFKALGCDVTVATADGSYGVKGFVTDALKALEEEGRTYTYFYTCGPEPMLKALYHATATSGQFSFEERMGCGFGACMGCSCKTLYGNKRICKDGPVLVKEEIIWEK
ncbi:MAG: dihydroorotate dehydrogenase electron transfer subunit [Clostridia bacterium]|nr:dihydroorotate dehydrogenase electron transfer subunit [Clostridia bacterium]